MARWIVFGEVAIGEVDAKERALAERAARRLFGERAVRVQSQLSLDAARSERRPTYESEDDE